MLEVSEAAERIYLLSTQSPKRNAVIRNPEGVTGVFGIRAHNPLGINWRTVWELVVDDEHASAVLQAEQQRVERADVEFDLIVDGYTFWFSGPECCVLPKSVTDIHKP